MAFVFPARLYPIVDPLDEPGRSHLDIAAALLEAGVRFFQLRVKHSSTARYVAIAHAVQGLAAARQAQVVVNDRADIAVLVGAAGVHVGQADLPPAVARQILGPDKIIGFSTHTVEQARAAVAAGGVDYIGFGPIFATRSKAHAEPVQGIDALRRVRRAVRLPIVAIGGITAATIAEVLAAGADAVAMISEISRADDVRARVEQLMATES